MKIMSPLQAADFLNTTVGTLRTWRCTKKVKIPYVKIGRNVVYILEDLKKWLAENKRKFR